MKKNNLRQDLGGAWQFQAARQKAWLPAAVPGNVHTDLMALGLLKDPLVAGQEAEAGWVEESVWCYRRSFHVQPQLLDGAGVRLIAEGLDTWCTLWLNGHKLGSTEDMFVEHSFEVARWLRPDKNELLLRFEPPKEVLKKLEKKQGYHPAVGDELRSHGRKAQYSFGWDWGPRLPTSGIFKPIYLEAVPALEIRDLWLRTLKASAAQASGVMVLEVHSDSRKRELLQASLGPWSLSKTVALKRGLNVLRLPWRIARPKLWWPRGHGRPDLTQAEASLGGSRATVEVGLRTVALERRQDKAGESFGFKVNGVSVYAKGANWIPADSFLGRLTPARVKALVQAAVDANYTMLRIWGGGLYESEDFYSACDRQGILVWQDFPFACNEVPEHRDFVRLVEAEAVKALRRLRRHASLALWCGNNENHTARHDHWFRGREAKDWGQRLYEKVLPALCAKLDPDRPYWPGSPFGGKDPNGETHGDRHHWLVWAQFKDIDDYRADRGRFLSEFGFAALPNRAVLRRAIPERDRWLQSRTLQMHDKVERGGAYARIAYYLHNHLPVAPGLDRFRYLSQVLQARALRTGIEQWRRNKPHTQGALIWQHNDCWPVTSWAVLDADDAPKLAWYGLREAYDDALLSAVEAAAVLHNDIVGRLPLRAAQEHGRCEAWLTLDGTSGWKGSLTVERWNMGRREAVLERSRVSVAANRSLRLWARDRHACGIQDPATQFLVFRLAGQDGRSRRALLFFERPRRLDLPESGLVVGAKDADGYVDIAVTARRTALAVELHAPVPGRFSDNGFDLLPGETKRLRFTPARPGVIRGAWAALCLNQMQAWARRA